MAVDEQDNPSESTPREAELQRQLDGLCSQVTNLFKAWEATQNLGLPPKIQSMEEQPDERSKQPEQSQEEFIQSDPRDHILPDEDRVPSQTGCNGHWSHILDESIPRPGASEGKTQEVLIHGAAGDIPKPELDSRRSGEPTETTPALLPRQDQTIHVISRGLATSDINHSEKGTWGTGNDAGATPLEHISQDVYDIRFKTEDQKGVLAPHHDALVVAGRDPDCSRLD